MFGRGRTGHLVLLARSLATCSTRESRWGRCHAFRGKRQGCSPRCRLRCRYHCRAAARRGPTAPAIGAWTMGTSIPRRSQAAVFMFRTPWWQGHLLLIVRLRNLRSQMSALYWDQTKLTSPLAISTHGRPGQSAAAFLQHADLRHPALAFCRTSSASPLTADRPPEEGRLGR